MSLDSDYAYYAKQAASDRKAARVLRSTGSNDTNDAMIEMLENRAAQWQALADEIVAYRQGALT